MARFDRNLAIDAQKVLNYLIENNEAQKSVTNFLVDAIVFANNLDSKNWNLNLDKNGKFIRFNVGQEYCIAIHKKYILVLAIKNLLSDEINQNKHQGKIQFEGYIGRERKLSNTLDDAPDTLLKVPGSVGCRIHWEYFSSISRHLVDSNKQFIVRAINTTKLMPQMANAHSSGLIRFLSIQLAKEVPNPIYAPQDGLTEHCLPEEVLIENEGIVEGAIRKISVDAYERSPEARRLCILAHGTRCVICGFDFGEVYGPNFDGYIHVHHLRPLSEIGKAYNVDPANDLRPVCPNCHAALHRRIPAYSIDDICDFLKNRAEIKHG